MFVPGSGPLRGAAAWAGGGLAVTRGEDVLVRRGGTWERLPMAGGEGNLPRSLCAVCTRGEVLLAVQDAGAVECLDATQPGSHTLPEDARACARVDDGPEAGVVGLAVDYTNSLPVEYDDHVPVQAPGPLLFVLDSNGQLGVFFIIDKRGKQANPKEETTLLLDVVKKEPGAKQASTTTPRGKEEPKKKEDGFGGGASAGFGSSGFGGFGDVKVAPSSSPFAVVASQNTGSKDGGFGGFDDKPASFGGGGFGSSSGFGSFGDSVKPADDSKGKADSKEPAFGGGSGFGDAFGSSSGFGSFGDSVKPADNNKGKADSKEPAFGGSGFGNAFGSSGFGSFGDTVKPAGVEGKAESKEIGFGEGGGGFGGFGDASKPDKVGLNPSFGSGHKAFDQTKKDNSKKEVSFGDTSLDGKAALKSEMGLSVVDKKKEEKKAAPTSAPAPNKTVPSKTAAVKSSGRAPPPDAFGAAFAAPKHALPPGLGAQKPSSVTVSSSADKKEAAFGGGFGGDTGSGFGSSGFGSIGADQAKDNFGATKTSAPGNSSPLGGDAASGFGSSGFGSFGENQPKDKNSGGFGAAGG